MALPIPTELPEPPKVYGDDCLACFPAGETPRYMTAFFSDILDCNPSEPPGHEPIPGRLVLEQHTVRPCEWILSAAEGWGSGYMLNQPEGSRLTMGYIVTVYFIGLAEEYCQKVFESELTCSNSEPGGSGGSAFVPSHAVTVALKNDREAFRIANTYNFSPARVSYQAAGRQLEPGEYEPDLKPAAEVRCVKLLHNSDETSILLLHKPAETYG